MIVLSILTRKAVGRSTPLGEAAKSLPSRSQALPGTALPCRLCLPNPSRRDFLFPATVEAEPLGLCGPRQSRQSLGPRMRAWDRGRASDGDY